MMGKLGMVAGMMGMGTNLAHAFSGEQMMNLGTHLFFSTIVALVYKATAPKQKQSQSHSM